MPVRDTEDFVRTVRRGDLSSDIAVSSAANRIGAYHLAAGDEAFAERAVPKADGSIGTVQGIYGEILGTVVVDQEENRFAIWREPRDIHVTVELPGENFRHSAGRWRDGEVLGGVLEKLGIKLGDVGDPLAVGRPGRQTIRAGIRSDLRRMGAFVGVVWVNCPNIEVVGAVGIGSGAIATEGDSLAVG